MSSWILIFASLIAVLMTGAGVYLWWQASINPEPYEEMFIVLKGEPIIRRLTGDQWEIVNLDGKQPETLFVKNNQTSKKTKCELFPSDGNFLAKAEVPPGEQVLFEICFTDGTVQETRERFAPMDGAHNFRDLGGYPTLDGREISWNRIFRSDGLDQLTSNDQLLLTSLGINLVCDLRSYSESSHRPDVLPRDISYLHLPVYSNDPIGMTRILFFRHRLIEIFKEIYEISIIEQGVPAFSKLLHIAADEANYPLVFHCTGGKDRTGFAAALLLSICQVDRKTILVDYSLTNLSIEEVLSDFRSSLSSIRLPPGFRVEQMYPLLSARPKLLENAFSYIEEEYGSIDHYITDKLGITEDMKHQIRQNLVI